MATEQRLQAVANAERKAPDRGNNLEPLAPHMVPQCPRQGRRNGCLASCRRGRPDDWADRAEHEQCRGNADLHQLPGAFGELESLEEAGCLPLRPSRMI